MAWKTTFRETYVVKRRAEAAREGEDKPFGGSSANKAHGQMRQKGNTASALLSPLPNQILDSLEGYLNNIAAGATQTAAKRGLPAELSASLLISVKTVSAQKKIKRLYKEINDMKKEGNPTSSIGTTAGGGMTGNVCPHCAVVERLSLHKKNACYFDPKKMTDKRDWDCKLMDEKGVACKDDD